MNSRRGRRDRRGRTTEVVQQRTYRGLRFFARRHWGTETYNTTSTDIDEQSVLQTSPAVSCRRVVYPSILVERKHRSDLGIMHLLPRQLRKGARDARPYRGAAGQVNSRPHMTAYGCTQHLQPRTTSLLHQGRSGRSSLPAYNADFSWSLAPLAARAATCETE